MHTFSVTPPTRARTHSKLLPIIKSGFADTVHDKGILVQRFNIQHYNVTVAALHFFSGPFQHLVSDKRFSKFPTSSNILSTFLGRFCSEKKKKHRSELWYSDCANRIWEHVGEEGRDLLSHSLPH